MFYYSFTKDLLHVREKAVSVYYLITIHIIDWFLQGLTNTLFINNKKEPPFIGCDLKGTKKASFMRLQISVLYASDENYQRLTIDDMNSLNTAIIN